MINAVFFVNAKGVSGTVHAHAHVQIIGVKSMSIYA